MKIQIMKTGSNNYLASFANNGQLICTIYGTLEEQEGGMHFPLHPFVGYTTLLEKLATMDLDTEDLKNIITKTYHWN